MLRKMLFGCALATVVALTTATSANAQAPANQTTFFTFSAPFELPGGEVLPAGKYTFKILDSPSNRHVVQIMSEDRRQVHATILAIPSQRPDPPSEPEVRFMETPANMPPAIRTWWYPGRSIGHEFIYPKEQARRLAARETEGVLTVATDAETTDTMKTADLTRIDRSGQETAVKAEATAEATTARASTSRSEKQPAPAPPSTPRVAERATPDVDTDTSADATARTRTALPGTATALPLVGLFGVASFAGAAVLRLRRRR